jgi:hypothetical protein
MPTNRPLFWIPFLGLLMSSPVRMQAQLDPYPRSLLQLGVDQAVSAVGPQSLYAYYYSNHPFTGDSNRVLRLVVAPLFVDGELGFRSLLSPDTDVGIGFGGGGYSENQFEIRKGRYIREESFDGHGGGGSLRLYHRINPGGRIPLSLVVQSGARFSTFARTGRTAEEFIPPADRVEADLRTGLRLAGAEPLLYPDLAMEMSVWIERRWRLDPGTYGYDGSFAVRPHSDVGWVHASLNYPWVPSGNQMTVSLTAGGTMDADRFSAWRLGGVLPLGSETPLALPGYFYRELSATRFVHAGATYVAPLSGSHRWQLRLAAAGAVVRFLPGLEQSGRWHAGVGPGLEYTSRNQVWRVVVHYGYGAFAPRGERQGAHSVGLLYQFNFEQRRARRSGFLPGTGTQADAETE